MFYALVHYPAVDTKRINQLRRKYDPQFDLIEPHITLVFPVPESTGEDNLINHLESILKNRLPFPIHLQGLEKSWDNYLFLLVEEGKRELVDLHDRIYTGVLAEFAREDVIFVPHLTLGLFAEDENQYRQALEEAKRLNLEYRCMVDKLILVKISDDRSRIVWGKGILFSS